MTRIDRLTFDHPTALFRGDGSGVALVLRTTPPASGPGWGRVTEAGAGIGAGYVYLRQHGDDIAVFAVDGTADDQEPSATHLDPRLRSLGEFFELADADEARRADAASGQKLRGDREAIRAARISVAGDADGRRWSVDIGPEIAGSTQLVLQDGTGGVRLLSTTAPRADLVRAQTTAVTIEATEMVDRRLGSGRRPRIVALTLRPAVGGAQAPR